MGGRRSSTEVKKIHAAYEKTTHPYEIHGDTLIILLISKTGSDFSLLLRSKSSKSIKGPADQVAGAASRPELPVGHPRRNGEEEKEREN